MGFLTNSTDTDNNDSYSQEFVIGTVVCLSLAAVLGLVGNGLIVIIIINARKLRSVMNRFILHLALGDLIVCVICIPLFLAINFYFQKNNHEWICKLARFLQYLAPQGSMMLLITIGINRHQAIVHPLRSMTYSTANKLIAGAWIYSVIVVSPSLYLTKVRYHADPSTNITQPYCATIPVSTRPGLMYVLALAVLGYFIPLTTLVVLYAKISHVVWKRDNTNDVDLRTSRPAEVMLKSRKKVIKMFLTVIVVFVVTWLPLIIYVGMLERYLYSTSQRISRVRLIFYSIGLSNSIYNPFIYSFFNKRFREGCKGIFRSSIHFIKNPGKRREAGENLQNPIEKSPKYVRDGVHGTPRLNQKCHQLEEKLQDKFSAEAIRNYNEENAVIDSKDNVMLIDMKYKSTDEIQSKVDQSSTGNQNNESKENKSRENKAAANDNEEHIVTDNNEDIAVKPPQELVQSRPTGETKQNKKKKLFKTFSDRPSTFQKRSDAKTSKPKLRKVESAFPASNFERDWSDSLF